MANEDIIHHEVPVYNLETIQRYLNRQMSAGEMQKFEQALEKDKFLADAVKGIEEDGWDEQDANNLSEIRDFVQVDSSSFTEVKKVAGKKKLRLFIIILAVLVVIAIVYKFWFYKAAPTSVSAFRKPNQYSVEELKRQADSIRRNHNPVRAAEIYTLILQVDSTDLWRLITAGELYDQIGNYKGGNHLLKKVLSIQENRHPKNRDWNMIQQAQMKLGFVYLHQKKYDSAYNSGLAALSTALSSSYYPDDDIYVLLCEASTVLFPEKALPYCNERFKGSLYEYLARAKAYAAMNKMDSACADIEEAGIKLEYNQIREYWVEPKLKDEFAKLQKQYGCKKQQ